MMRMFTLAALIVASAAVLLLGRSPAVQAATINGTNLANGAAPAGSVAGTSDGVDAAGLRLSGVILPESRGN